VLRVQRDGLENEQIERPRKQLRLLFPQSLTSMSEERMPEAHSPVKRQSRWRWKVRSASAVRAAAARSACAAFTSVSFEGPETGMSKWARPQPASTVGRMPLENDTHNRVDRRSYELRNKSERRPTVGERITLWASPPTLLRILNERGIRREWESSKRFFHCLPILSVGLQLFRILPLGAKRDLPLFSVVYRQFRIFPFRWHSKCTRRKQFVSVLLASRR
jgi:hypothetical protein